MLYKNSNIVRKKQHGQFFTHPAIARQIVREVCGAIISERFWKPLRSFGNSASYSNVKRLFDRVLTLRFVDPAMGNGVFLIEVIHFFEAFLSELWEETCSSSYLDHICTYFKQKLKLDFSLVGKRDKLTFDIWKFHVIRSMVYGVDLDLDIVQQARNIIIKEISSPRLMKLAQIAVQFNFKVGNSLISPIRMNNESRDLLLSQYRLEVNVLLSQRIQLQMIRWNESSEKEIIEILEENEKQKVELGNKLFNKIASINFFSFLIDTNYRKQVSFLWELEFPEVFFSNQYGFNAVIGNPPWEKWKLYDREWLGSTAIGKADYAQQIKAIQENDSESHSRYLELKDFYKNTTEYFNTFFQWQPGEKNLFKLFFERFYTLCCLDGFLGVILPGGLLGEYYSQPLRQLLLTRMNLQLIIEIVSNKEMFPDAEAGLSILIVLAQKSTAGEIFPFMKTVSTIDAISKINTNNLSKKTNNLIYFSQADILKASPNCIIPAVRNQLELKIIRKMTEFPSLSSNTWGCKTSRGVDMTNDRNLLVKDVTPFPLIEGRHLVRLGYDDIYPRYWIRSFDEYQRKIPFWNQTIIVWKNFSGNHRRRRMRVAILPPKAVISNSVICLYNLPNIPNIEFYLAGIMCSIPWEFRIRQLCYGININQYIVDNMPVPYLDSNIYFHQEMISIVKEFIPRGREWAKEKMESLSSLSKSRLERNYLDTITKIDAVAALIYTLTREEFKTTLEAHPLLEQTYQKKGLQYFDLFSSIYDTE